MLNQRISLISGISLIVICSMMLFYAVEIHDKYPPTPKKYAHYKKISFDLLSGYDYRKTQKIPDRVKVLNNMFVYLEGRILTYDIDLKGNRGETFSFIAVKYKHWLQINEYLSIEMKEPYHFYRDVPVKVYGQLSVGEEYKDKHLDSLYRMKDEIVVSPIGTKPFKSIAD